MKDWAYKYHVWGTPHEVTFKAKLAIIQKRGFSLMCSYIRSVVYICRTISCLKGFTLLYRIPHKDGMHMSLEIY